MEDRNQIAYRPNIPSEDPRAPRQQLLVDELTAKPRTTAHIAVSRGLAKRVSLGLSPGGVGIPWPTGVLLPAQTAQREKLG
jgi:hypothetical protein